MFELKQIKTSDDVSIWRKALFKELCSMYVSGESSKEMLDFSFDHVPSEEEINEISSTAPQVIYKAAKKLNHEFKFANEQIEK